MPVHRRATLSCTASVQGLYSICTAWGEDQSSSPSECSGGSVAVQWQFSHPASRPIVEAFVEA